VVNSTARNLRLQRTQTLGVVIPLAHETSQPLSDPFFMEMLGWLADAITQRGYGMFLLKVLPPMEGWLSDLIASQRADGIIVIGQSTEHATLEAAALQYKTLVVWGGHLATQSYCTVGTDNVGGALAAVEHLIRLGRKRIIFVGDPSLPEIGLRYEGYRLAHERAPGLRAPPQLVSSALTPDAAYEAVRAFISSGGHCDAIFAATDVIAMSALRALTASGIAVPGQVSVVGFDDIALAAHANPPLTTVRQDIESGAYTLVDLLFRRMAGEEAPSSRMPAELVVRESSG
jgi:DNA-binding LacI/PurR family transcriptional regulator